MLALNTVITYYLLASFCSGYFETGKTVELYKAMSLETQLERYLKGVV